MPTRIRPAAARDLAALQGIEDRADRILVELLRPSTWWPAPTGAERAAEPGFLLVAEEEDADADGQLVGFAHVLEVDGLAHLEQVAVPPEHGRRGHGGALVEAAAAEARRRGHRRITLRTFADVPWNAPAYTRAGFVEEPPATPFHLRLVETEARLGLDLLGRRVQMGRALGSGPPVTVDGDAFVDSIRARFSAHPELAPGKSWVAGRARADGSAVVLYRASHSPRVLGRRWMLEELAQDFSPSDARSLASAVFANEVGEPDGPPASLAVDWADGLVDDPSAVGWVVNRWTGADG